MKRRIIGGTIGFAVGGLFIWLYGAFLQWDLMWISEVATWSTEDRIGYSLLWFMAFVMFTGIGLIASEE